MMNNATFEEIGQIAVPQQFSSLLGTGRVSIHDFFVTNASPILFYLAPYRCFRVLSPSRPI